MRNIIIDIISYLIILHPLFLGLWIGFCKYLLHRKGCNNHNCIYRCNRCPLLPTEQLELRIALLEKNHPEGHAYIQVLKKQLEMYRDESKPQQKDKKETMYSIYKRNAKKDDSTSF